MSLVDIIKCNSNNPNLIIWKYPSEEIKLGSQIVVNQSQEAIFVKNGKILDIFGPGTHTIETGNMPILSNLFHTVFGQNKTVFTAEIWFINKVIHRGLKWGSQGTIQVLDSIYKVPVSVRAFGEWGFRINDSVSFLTQIVGAKSLTDTETVEKYFTGEIIQKLSNCIATHFSNISIFQINSQVNMLSELLIQDISTEFDRFGIEIINFNIMRISIPEEEQKKFQDVLFKKMEVAELSNTNISQNYITLKTLDAVNKSAENGKADISPFIGAGLGMGAGIPLGQKLSENINVGKSDISQKLQTLKNLFDQGLITQEDFDKKKQELLSLL